ncbi:MULTISPECIES: agmatine deiminase family protein [unclassified Fibrobacter]|uniref:agmatine deiminase family protein n=1 Tax=unclassified Fibrobacter TaxID=2634177 RepID=UPI000B52109D|nr:MULTISPECIES: agmatine deiminase family protein [Fibrobacter]MCL4100815.1 putative agmatine deiminase [Fibrobacter succinogenes]OWV08171.1 agmatine deiminase [Fibrobacter sp. UWH3]
MATSNSLRYPAEWEEQAATWLAFPHNPKNWNGERGVKIRAFYFKLIKTITDFQPVNVIVPSQKFFSDEEKSILASCKHPANVMVIKNNDIWIRDYGPFFMQKGKKKVIVETQFNAWGAKFPPWTLDNKIPAAIAEKTGTKLVKSVPYIFEGGAIEVNGDGLGITTLDCLIGKNRNADKDLPKVVKALCSAFGLRDLLVLPHGLHGDHTDGHIDNVARFVEKDRVVMCWAEGKSPNAPILAEAKYLLEAWLKKHYGDSAKVDTLPMPPQRTLPTGEIMPASYMNFIYANGALIFPKYKSPNDAVAMKYFQSVYPDRKIIAIDSRTVLEEGGSLHCMSKHENA